MKDIIFHRFTYVKTIVKALLRRMHIKTNAGRVVMYRPAFVICGYWKPV